jgi:hypothetical protein
MRNRPKAIPKAPVRAAEETKPARTTDDAPPPRERDRPRDRDRGPRPARPEARREEAPRDTAREMPRESVRETPREERGRRDYRGRDDRFRGDHSNDGPVVRGFGADVPAFMLLAKRGPLSAIMDDLPDEDEIIVDQHIVDTDKDEEIAA